METKAIVNFLQVNYSDEKLAALLAHAEDGKLVYNSCCCFIGIPTASHSLQGDLHYHPLYLTPYEMPEEYWHAVRARNAVVGASLAEQQFRLLGNDDTERRERLIPLVREEIARRDVLREIADAVRLPEVSGNELSGERTQNTLSSDRQLSHK